MYAGSIPARASTSQTRECAALAQLVEHIIRNDGVTCSSHVSGTTFFPFYFNMLRILERAWIIATIPPLVVLDFWNSQRGDVAIPAGTARTVIACAEMCRHHVALGWITLEDSNFLSVSRS